MKYTKPQITNTESASGAIMNIAPGKPDQTVSDGLNPFSTNPAYSADE